MELADILAELEEMNPDAILLEPRSQYDEAIIGIGSRFSDGPLVIYDTNRILKILQAECVANGDDPDEALFTAREHFEFNIIGGWLGSGTPIFASEMRDGVLDSMHQS